MENRKIQQNVWKLSDFQLRTGTYGHNSTYTYINKKKKKEKTLSFVGGRLRI